MPAEEDSPASGPPAQSSPMSKTDVALVDCDGVLAGFFEGMAELVLRTAGVEILPEDFSGSWSFSTELEEVLKRKGCIDPNVMCAHVRQEMMAPGFCLGLPLLGHAVEMVESLWGTFDRVLIVTSPYSSNPTWMEERCVWLNRHLGVERKDVVLTDSKEFVYGSLFIDDKPENVRSWGARWGGGTRSVTPALLWGTPFNRKDDAGLRRVDGWEALLSIIDGLQPPRNAGWSYASQ